MEESLLSWEYLTKHCFFCNFEFRKEEDYFFSVNSNNEYMSCNGSICRDVMKIIPLKKKSPGFCALCRLISKNNLYEVLCYRCVRIEEKNIEEENIGKKKVTAYPFIKIPEKILLSYSVLEQVINSFSNVLLIKYSPEELEEIKKCFFERKKMFLDAFNMFCLYINKILEGKIFDLIFSIRKLIFKQLYPWSNPWAIRESDTKNKKLKIENY
jgi:hypothetical protein